MELIIQSLHLDVSQRTLDLLTRKFDKLEAVYDRISKCNVVIKKEKNKLQNNFVVEAKLFVPRKVLFAEERSANFLVAAGKTVSDLSRQLKVHKAKLNKRVPAIPTPDEEED